MDIGHTELSVKTISFCQPKATKINIVFSCSRPQAVNPASEIEHYYKPLLNTLEPNVNLKLGQLHENMADILKFSFLN